MLHQCSTAVLVLPHHSLVTWEQTELLAELFSKYCHSTSVRGYYPTLCYGQKKKCFQDIPHLRLGLWEGFSSVDSQVGRQLMAPGR